MEVSRERKEERCWRSPDDARREGKREGEDHTILELYILSRPKRKKGGKEKRKGK